MSETSPNTQPLSDHASQLWATLIHLGGILFLFLPALFGFAVLGERGPFIRQQARSALNFQLTTLIGYLAGFCTVWFFIGAYVLLTVMVINVVFSIAAAIAANKGENWSYPISIPFITA